MVRIRLRDHFPQGGFPDAPRARQKDHAFFPGQFLPYIMVQRALDHGRHYFMSLKDSQV
jgi:hypothetical protein